MACPPCHAAGPDRRGPRAVSRAAHRSRRSPNGARSTPGSRMNSRVALWVSTTSPATSSKLIFGMAKSVHAASSKRAFSKRVAASCRFLSWLSYSALVRSIIRCRSGSPSGVATSFCLRGATRRRATGGSATGGSERRRCAAVKGVRADSVLS